MARKKAYKEEEVIEKAMELFWEKGYEVTSVRMLEKAMGINQFSMYSSFKNKKGVFLESLECYKKKAKRELIDKLKESSEGVDAIKQYFYDFIAFSRIQDSNRGCLITNTVSELGEKADPEILRKITSFATDVKDLFIEKLATDKSKTVEVLEMQANYLMVSLQGLSVASKMFTSKQLDDFIKNSFNNI